MLRRAAKMALLPHGALFRERRPGLVILIYHRVGGGTASEIDLPEGLFERQMAYLRDHARVVALDAVLDGSLDDAGGGPGDAVAVTFDDGSRDLYEQAFPVLLRYRIPATVFLVTRYIETQTPFDFGAYGRSAHRSAPLTWPQVREMAASGLVTIGGHTHGHVDLTRVPDAEARAEVERCAALIADRVGQPPAHFAYPWGRLSPRARAIAGERFRTAVRGGSAKNPFGSLDLLGLWRRPVQQSDGFWLFTMKVRSYLDGEEVLREFVSSRRQAGRAAGLA
ncbi:MAG: polysaccharide deacetylase family protein [Armatimonadota bacterium]|nr:polysaccharide deacetylase family protein [Armatimonadota bacterium]